jgi:hypothetical protein
VLRRNQIWPLVALGAVFWALVMLNIRLRPQAVVDPIQGLTPFVAAPLAGWLSVWLCKRIGRLSSEQLLPGVALVGAVAMMIDGAVLKWWPHLYGLDEQILRVAAAGLLWGYGVAFAVALIWVSWRSRAPLAVPDRP